jgi:flagellar biosynthesis component FlhA
MSFSFAFASSVGRQGELIYSFFSVSNNKVRQTGWSKISVVARGWVEFGLTPRKCGLGVKTQGVARVVLSCYRVFSTREQQQQQQQQKQQQQKQQQQQQKQQKQQQQQQQLSTQQQLVIKQLVATDALIVKETRFD